MFSSWSLRGWLMFEKFGIPVRTHLVGLYSGTMQADLAPLHPARLVPAVMTPEGTPLGESLAIAETLAERHPEAGHWPNDPAQRATARWLCAEMVAGFRALRNDCPMQLLRVYKDFQPSAEVLDDLARIETLWAHARKLSGSQGYLFGAYSLADVYYTPVAARIIGYDLPVSAEARAYCLQLLADPAVQAWRNEGLKITYDPEPYRKDLPSQPWPEAALQTA
ncbi:glutathione S-transferase [Seohaeicola zhoushanensis]|uniref:glutathione S-transferase n=1 Tax=Seohaeicola zhoushanensis TaxID=1569283 RepID=UPI0027E5381F|nr:glutathione S-transferase [Seohaeicola zhoushanensis]